LGGNRADPVAIPLMLQNIKTETQDTRKRVRAFVPKVNTQRTVLLTFPTPLDVLSLSLRRCRPHGL
jgi:hypothetical protein